MNSLAASLLRTRGTPGFFGQLIQQPFIQLKREYHDPCEPRHLSWQWRVKDKPDVEKCSKLCLKKKACPKKRFFPRFKKSFIYQDIVACDPPVQKKLSWTEYLSFLLPDEYTNKPQMGTCRKMLEHRRKKCIDSDDYTRCIQGECWPLPTEWYGQGVLHISELSLTKPPPEPPVQLKPCPPPSSTITRCVEKDLPVCPGQKICNEEIERKMPYSLFKGADTDGSPPTLTLKCPIKYHSELLPERNPDRGMKLSCRTYGEFKSVECPKQMFNRYMSVDMSSKGLIPVPVTAPGYTPQREVKKGVCGRQTLLKPPGARNFSTGSVFHSNDYPEYVRVSDASHLQPGQSPICFDKLMERAGMDSELLYKSHSERAQDAYKKIRDSKVEKDEEAARLSEETPYQKQRRINSKKTKLQLLSERREKGQNDQTPSSKVPTSAAPDSSGQPKLNRLIDLEDVPYQRSKFHTSALQLARKGAERRGGPKKPDNDEDKICSGCPGIRAAENEGTRKAKGKCSRGGVRGRCRNDRVLRPGEKISPLSVKCKSMVDSPCMRARGPTEPFLIGVPSRFLHLTLANAPPLRERYVLEDRLSTRSSKAPYSQQSKDLLDQCCEQLDQMKKQVEAIRKEQRSQKNEQSDDVKQMLNQCCDELNKLKSHLESMQQENKGKKSNSETKDRLDRCCEMQEELKKQIEMLKQKKGDEKKGTKKQDPCEDKTSKNPKQPDEDPCKKEESKTINCKKIKEKKEKAEECAKYLAKQNDKLRKEMEAMKKKLSQHAKKDDCGELEKEKAKAEESVKKLLAEKEKLESEMKKLQAQVNKADRKDSKAKKNVCTPKSVCAKGKKGKKEGTGAKKDDIPEDVQKMMTDCVKKCAKKVKKEHLKKALNAEKKKCKEELKKKAQQMKAKQGDGEEDGNVLASFLQSLCCKLQDLAKKTKKKKKKC